MMKNNSSSCNVGSSAGGVPILPGGSNVFTLVSVSETQMVLAQNITYMGSTQMAQATLIH